MKKINIINIEDSSYDSLLMKMELENSGIQLGAFVRVETAEEFINTIPVRHWDVVICDYYLPFFNTLDALKIVGDSGVKLPLILFSGQSGQDTIQKVLNAGAEAVVNKDHKHLLFKTIEQVVFGKEKSSFELKTPARTEQQNQLTTLDNSDSVGTWEWDIVNDNLNWNEQTLSIYGLSKGQFGNDAASWISFVHTEDKAILHRSLQYSLNNRQSLLTEFRIIRPDGAIRYIKACGLAQWNSAGVALRMVGIQEDITYCRKIENDLYVNSLVLDEDPSGVLVTDDDGRIVKANKNLTALLGYSQNELLGKRPWFLLVRLHTKFLYGLVKKLLKHNCWQDVVWIEPKTGGNQQHLLTVTAINNHYQNTVFYSCSLVPLGNVKELSNKQLIEFDLLTGLPNRYALTNKLKQTVQDVNNKRCFTALLYIDLDRFQVVNDTFGCAVGDTVLRMVGQRIKAHIRGSDTVSRLAGDEFAVLIERLDNSRQNAYLAVKEISESLRSLMKQPLRVENSEVFISCSIGITIHSDEDFSVDNMLNYAKNALLQAKKSKDRIHFFTAGMKSVFEYKTSLEHELHNALSNKEFHLVYQPQIRNHNITGIEVLLRWQSAKLGNISPLEFISIAEETGLITEIGQWVLEQVCNQVKRWEIAGMFDTALSSVAINVSALQFKQNNFASNVIKTIEQSKIEFSHIKLEVTESLLLNDEGDILETFKVLKSFGIQFAIDDFGTGYSSFSYLNKLPVDLIKIDKTFVNNICQSEKELAVVKAIIAVAKALGIDIIAEGVEAEEQAALLKTSGCDFFQGYFYSRPVAESEMSQLLQSQQKGIS